jgi:hypothetical protein
LTPAAHASVACGRGGGEGRQRVGGGCESASGGVCACVIAHGKPQGCAPGGRGGHGALVPPHCGAHDVGATWTARVHARSAYGQGVRTRPRYRGGVVTREALSLSGSHAAAWAALEGPVAAAALSDFVRVVEANLPVGEGGDRLGTKTPGVAAAPRLQGTYRCAPPSRANHSVEIVKR